MKKLDEYFSTYNKNLDILSSKSNDKSIQSFDENYIPKSKISKTGGLSILSKVLISTLVTFSVLITTFMLIVPDSDNNLIANLINSKQSSQSLDESKKDSNYYNFNDLVYLELNVAELEQIGIIMRNDSIFIEGEFLYNPQLKDSVSKSYSTVVGTSDTKLPIVLPQRKVFNTKKISKHGYDTSKTQLVKNQSVIAHYRFRTNTINYNGWNHSQFNQFAPVSIHNHSISFFKKKGRYSEKRMVNEEFSPILKGYKVALDTMENYFSESNFDEGMNKLGASSKLIPVKITLNNNKKLWSKEKKYTIDQYLLEKTEVYLWYVPTEELLNALPERYSLRIRNELQIIDKIENGEISTKEACSELGKEESLLGICLNYHENLEIKSIYPSPGRDDTHLKFSNGKEQKLSVYLYDMTGKEVKCIADKKLFLQGEHNLWIDLSNLISGIYIAVIIDDEGNAISSKFIKE